MTQDETGTGTTLVAPQAPLRQLRRLLRRYAKRIAAVERAESAYHDVVLVESLRQQGKPTRASDKRVNAAFSALVDAVIDLQTAQAEVSLLADDEGLAPAAVAAASSACSAADSDHAGYLAARTYEQVRDAAAQRHVRPR